MGGGWNGVLCALFYFLPLGGSINFLCGSTRHWLIVWTWTAAACWVFGGVLLYYFSPTNSNRTRDPKTPLRLDGTNIHRRLSWRGCHSQIEDNLYLLLNVQEINFDLLWFCLLTVCVCIQISWSLWEEIRVFKQLFPVPAQRWSASASQLRWWKHWILALFDPLKPKEKFLSYHQS